MDIVRKIEVFDNVTELLVDELPLHSFDLDIFKSRFNVNTDDPQMYFEYEITSAAIDLFPFLKFEFEKYTYYIVCYHAL